ncbi:uncharacterized protein MELLADRAFT_48491 [Melampsora larici-populina 98AG31]|uniref:HECT-type E3 ubiquitin transferase n=1 Tax=Melampsora larici-populina (strain 98AG31 / pathotype 3-4-7) TaxID=747676 RepID=F4RMU7_MELLP|nr:uncharacterized protein MELLADRAFT_48491 [Melampsora larici-populina 98AG31]EGG06319.1 hypothetical protein MELLADRAFT_48491 [Melampsora larici-populina 98AG31]
MAGFTNRLKNILNSLKARGPNASTDRLVALQELAEILAVSTEDTLAGYFQTDSFARELVAILKGQTGRDRAREDDDDEGEEEEEEEMLLASRCLANLMEALPGSAHTVVHHGAVPVLCAKLLEINFIDLAEQSLSTLEKISEELPASIVREGGLTALLQYLDFFSTNVQRTAVTAAANCCCSVSADSFPMVREVFPILRNVLSYSDQRVSEQAVLAITRVTDSYRHHPDKLQQLLTPDVLTALTSLLSPIGGTKISDSIFSAILKSFTNIGRSSAEVAINLLDAGLADTIYGILVGQLPPDLTDEYDLASELTKNSSIITQALMRKDKAQIQQAIDLIVEVLPPLPKEDIKPDISSVLGLVASHGSPTSTKELTKEAMIAHRIELLESPAREVTVRRLNALLLPTLLEVYGASVSSTIRVKALVAMLKIAYFNQPDYLSKTLKPIPMASFLASILANRDQTALVLHALQMVDLLLCKLPDDYHFFFRREGVMHEVDRLADQSLSSPSSSNSKHKLSHQSLASSTESDSLHSTMPASALIDNYPPSSLISSSLQVPMASSSRRSGVLQAFAAAYSSSSSSGTRDQPIYRARQLRNRYAGGETSASLKAQAMLDHIRNITESLSIVDSEHEAATLLKELAQLFSQHENPVSSFELSESGLVGSLLRYATETRAFGPSLVTRRALLSKAFIGSFDSSPAYVPLVKRLQESLGRLEGFEVLTAVASTPDDSRRSTASLLARQLKIRLVAAEGTDVPKNCANVVVSIHAIATFQAFSDYLRPRIIKGQDDERLGRPSSSGRLSGMLAAFAAAAGLPSSVASSGIPDSASAFTLPSTNESHSNLPPTASPSSSAPTATPTVGNTDGSSAQTSYVPRRSSRLISATDPLASTSALLNVDDRGRGDIMDVDEQISGPIDEDVMDSQQSNSNDEPPINVQPTADGTKIEVHTPHGTRVATPLSSRPPSSLAKHSGHALVGMMTSSASSLRPSKSSYAAAVKAEPKDWHLTFSLGGQAISLDTTIYGAVYTHELQTGGGQAAGRNLWNNVYTVTYRKHDGPAPTLNEDASSVTPGSREEAGSLPASIPEGSQQAAILRLLRALYVLNLDWAELQGTSATARNMAEAEAVFINNKLTAKLNRQLEEPMIVASACLPDWACDLPQQFPFLFPFETRQHMFTIFRYSLIQRLIQKWVGQARSDSSRRDENLGLLGRLQRQKVRISRQKILESLIKVFELYSSCRAMLEVEYFDEVGTGLGPTLEFFSLASKAFAERQYKMWRDHEGSSDSVHVFSKTGLFPAPMDQEMCESESGLERLKKFKVLGQFMAKALMDSRIVDISLSRSFAKLVLDYEVPQTIESVKLVDSALAGSLEHLMQYVVEKRRLEAELSGSELEEAIKVIRIDGATVEDLALEFVLPGYDEIEMKPDGSDKTVTIGNIEEFIDLVIDWTLSKGVAKQLEVFKSGFSTVFPIRDLKSFTPDEIVNIFGNAEMEDWSAETLTSSMRADHGYNMESRAIRDLIQIMSTYDVTSRREFLQFITGAPKLPIGGFRGLHPPLTVVRKAAESGHVPDEYLPSVMTCVNYLKLPEYSSTDVATQKLDIAMREGADSFHLS